MSDKLQELQLKLREKVVIKVDNGEKLTPEESALWTLMLSENKPANNNGYRQRKGEGMMWDNQDPKKEHSAVTTITVDVENPVTKEPIEVELLVLKYDNWAFSDRKMVSKTGKVGHRLFITQIKPKAGDPDPSSDEEGKPRPSSLEDSRNETKAPVTTERGKAPKKG